MVTDFNLNGPPEIDSSITPYVYEEVIDNASEELLIWHNRYSHIGFKRLQAMAKMDIIPKRLANCKVPVCQACLYGKQTKRPWKSKSKEQSHIIKVNSPGACVSVGQLESSTPGLIAQLKGFLTRRRYKVATVFVDHFSKLSFIHFQTSTSASETLDAKIEFERFAMSHGVSVKHYHADNGRFSENAWKEDVMNKQQRLTFCGVGAHHQNGLAEKRIRDIQDLARTALIYANRRWPDAINEHLWPYAMKHANETINKTPFSGENTTPLEFFSNVKVSPNPKEVHPFGCPVYALDGRLQGGNKIGKWCSRSRLAIYLGTSANHSQSVGLLLSLQTGLVSPQYHCRYDNLFQTIKNLLLNSKSEWQEKCGFINNDSKVTPKPTSKNPPSSPEQFNDPTEYSPTTYQDEITELVETAVIDEPADDDSASKLEPGNQDGANMGNDAEDEGVPHIRTRYGRTIRPPSRYNDYVSYAVQARPSWDNTMEFVHPISMAASSDPDVMNLNEALKQPDKAEFKIAMVKEVNAHTVNGNWKLIPISEVPNGHDILPAVWAMRRKRDISTRQVYKWKARINVHGGRQKHGVNYWETYAPVASWASIRLVMNMAALAGWETRQLDFVLAFPQAPVETDLYMEVPRGFEIKGSKEKYVLKLINNLYGQKQAGRVWNQHLTKGLIEIGFTQSQSDPCIYWRGTSILIVIYTDDTIVTGPNSEELSEIIKDIGNKFDITSQLTVNDFLGVNIKRDTDSKTFSLTQPHLIKSILSDLGLSETSNNKSTPAITKKLLHQHLDSPPHSEPWHYRSVIGKLNYLEKSTRPDIAFAVHQCARFCENPRYEHSKAVKMIGRYLCATMDKGIICKPNDESFVVYCDADFAGTWNPDVAEFDKSTARSRSGYVIKYGNCPIVWASKLQTEIALSSTESEYVSLSQSLREVLPLMRLVTELALADFHLNANTPKVHCKVFEDNSGALEMARTPKMRPRTKHMNLKYHHFREAVDNGLVSIFAIDTLDQQADLLTKPLAEASFVKLRELIMGW